MLTAEERILLHLLDHVRRAERFEVPFAMSQSGIALAAGARRSHVSATLSEMEKRELVTKRLAHLEGGGRRRKVYVLTPRGAQAAESLRQRIAASRVRVRTPTGEQTVPLAQALPLAGRGATLLELALGVTDGFLDLERAPRPGPPAGSTPRRFYGRAEELAAAKAFARSHVACLSVRGLPGVGKTALLARVAETSDLPVAWIRVTEWTTPDHVVGAIAAKLRSLGRSVEVEGNLEDAIGRIQAALAEAPLLTVVDDVHKAPGGVVQLLASLLEACRTTRAKLLVAGRRLPPFYTRREVRLDGLVEEIELGGLDEESAGRLLTDRGVPEDRRSEVLAVTKGHPLFLELMAASGGRGLSDVRAYLREEVVAKLEPEEQEILASLAVHRHPVAIGAVAPELTHLARIESLADRSLVRLGDDNADLHDLLREFFYARLSTTQRLRLHAAAAEFYESQTEPEDRIEMVYHMIQAGEPAEAAGILGGVGRSLVAKGFPDEVLRLIGLLHLGALEAPDRIPLLLLRGDVLSMRGDWHGAEESFDEAASLAEDVGERRGHARAVFELGVLEYRRGDFDAARARYERSLEIVGTADEAIVARVLNALGILEWQAGNLTVAADFYARSRSAYERAGDLAGVAGAINNLGILRWQLDDIDGALTHYAEALRLSEELGDHRTVAILYNNIGEAYRRKGDAPSAAKFYDRSLALSERLGFLWQMGEVHRNLGRLRTDANGVAHLEKALSIFDSLGARRDRDEVVQILQARRGTPP